MKTLMCSLAFILVLAMIDDVISAGSCSSCPICPDGWYRSGKSCYKRLKKSNYEKAQSQCVEAGAQMVPRSVDKEVLKSLGLRNSQNVWLSSEDGGCTVLNSIGSGEVKVHGDCSGRCQVVCAKDLDLDNGDWVSDTNNTGKQYLDLKLYTIYSQADAKDLCKYVGGILPEPKNEEENCFLNSLITKPFYLGMSDTAEDGQWVWDSDGSPVAWTLWSANEPDGGTIQNCAFMWRDLISDPEKQKMWASGLCVDSSTPPTQITVICERTCPLV